MARTFGILGSLDVPLALGLLRLTIEGRPSESDASAVIHAALDGGVRVLDTADSYALDASDFHFGETLARKAVESWGGPRDQIKILTKVGMTRPKGRWVPNGKPDHLHKAVEGSLKALGVERLFLLQLHVHDSRVPFEETLACLADLQRAGKVEHLGLCNTTPAEIRQAQRHFPVAVVQNELSVVTRKSATDGTLACSRELNIPFLAHRSLGGYAKVAKLEKNQILAPLGMRHNATPHQMALAALLDAGDNILPLVGATRIESVQSSLAATKIPLDVSDRTALSIRYSFAPAADALVAFAPVAAAGNATPTDSSAPLASMASLPADPGPSDQPEVVVLMGIQGAGKSELVTGYLDKGYHRLNRDLLGGRLDDLVPRLRDLLAAGQKRVVLDNTYPTRISRAPVIMTGHAHRVPVRCRYLATPITEARVNVVLRQLQKYGRLLGPDEMKSLAKTDPNLPPPPALGRWASSFEPPAVDEGFAAVDTIPFVRRIDPSHTQKALLLDVDGTLRKTRSGELYPRQADDLELLPGRREILATWVAAGYQLFFVSNQSGIHSGKLTRADAEAAFLRTAQLLALPVAEVAYCPHSAFPVGCYCRKPLPGLGVYLMERHRLDRAHLIVVGDMASDAEFAAGIGARYVDAETFFSLNGPRPE